MDTNFQTSFIPKKTSIPEREVNSRPIGLLTVISILVFLTAVIGTGALYFYKLTLSKGIVKMENDLVLAKNRFEPEKLSQLELLNRRIEAAKVVLNKHIAIAPILTELGKTTKKSVRYTKFNYSAKEEDSKRVLVQLKGFATDYRSVSLQSDLFSKNKYFIDPIFSNMTLNDKGNILFDLEFSVDPNLIDYKKVMEGTNVSESVTSEITVPEATALEALVPETATPEATTSEATTSESANSKSATSENVGAESTTSEKTTPEKTTPQTKTSEPTTTKTTTPESTTQESSTPQPTTPTTPKTPTTLKTPN